jgi:hypothetical protein
MLIKFSRIIIASLFLIASNAWAGAIFLTGHDPDFHASNSAGTAIDSIGAVHINQTAISYILDPTYKTFSAGGVNKFLFVESSITPPGGHRVGKNGIIQSGYAEGADFVHADATTLASQLDLLGTEYAGIVVASDFGGILTQAELDILNARSGDIIDFLNEGGGIYAMAEGNSGAGLTPDGGYFGFLPFVVSSTAFNSAETGVTVTSYGASLGLTNSDVSSNYSHNIFTNTGGLNVVDTYPSGSILTLAGRGIVDPGTGIVPAPPSLLLMMLGFAVMRFTGKKRI